MELDEFKKLKALLAQIKVNGDKSLVPLPEDLSICGFALIDDDFEPAINFFKFLSQATSNNYSFGFIDSQISMDDIASYREDLMTTELLLLPIFKSFKGNDDLLEIATKLNTLSCGFRTITVFFEDTPLAKLLNANTIIEASACNIDNVAATILLLSGKEIE